MPRFDIGEQQPEQTQHDHHTFFQYDQQQEEPFFKQEGQHN